MRNLAVAWLLGGLLVLSAAPLTAHEAQSYFDAGVQAFTQGKLAEAQAQLSQAIASYADYAQAHYMLGHIALKSGQREEAFSQFKAGEKAYGKYSPNLKMILKMRRGDI